MMLKILRCDVKGCTNEVMEPVENAGFLKWGHVQGVLERQADGSIREIAYLCPKCLNKVIAFLNGGREL